MDEGFGPVLSLAGGYKKWKKLGYPIDTVLPVS